MMKIRKNEYLGIIRVGLALLAVCPAYATELYVAANGRDANLGSLKRPFATIERARDEVRKLVAAGLKENVTVFIRGGTYLLAHTVVFGLADSGTKEHTITYAAYPGETPVFSGGIRISGYGPILPPGSSASSPSTLPESVSPPTFPRATGKSPEVICRSCFFRGNTIDNRLMAKLRYWDSGSCSSSP